MDSLPKTPDSETAPEAVPCSALLAAIGKLESEFSRFVAGKRARAGIGGQTVGHEGYRLDFCGFNEGAVWDAIIAVREAANSDSQTKVAY